MNATEILVPRKGLLVRDPWSKDILPVEGAKKPLVGTKGKYWKRRLRVGDVSIQEAKSTYKPSSERKRFTGGDDE